MADINFENYKNKSAKGLWLVVKTGKGLAIQRKQFNIDDGTEVKPTLEYFDLAQLTELQTKLKRQVADITTLIDEAGKL